VASVSVILIYGSSAHEEIERSMNVQQAEQALTNLDSEASQVALGESDGKRVSFGGGVGPAEDLTIRDTGQIRLVHTLPNGTEKVLVNETLGAVLYQRNDHEVAYQGGGVWKKTENGSRMVSAPEVHYRRTTMTLPIIVLDGGEEGSPGPGQMMVSSNGTEQVDSYSNPISSGAVNLTVQSRFYEAWGSFFEQRTEGVVNYDHDAQEVTLQLVTPKDDPTVSAGIASAAGGSDKIELDNKAVLNSFDSSAGETPCDGACGTEGDIIATGDVKLNSGNIKVRGDITAGGTVEVNDNNVKIKGDVRCAKGNHDCFTGPSNTVKGSIVNIDEEVETPDPVGDLVADKMREIGARHDNNDTAAIDGGRLDWSQGDTLVLTSGKYYLEEITMGDSGYTLVLDTSGGDIELAVDGDFHMDGSTIEVRGDTGTVQMYADFDGNDDMDLNGGHVKVFDGSGKRTYEAPRMWLFAPPGIEADLKDGSRRTEFTGVIYGPDSETTAGKVQLEGAAVYGAIVAHVDGADEGNKRSEIHFDEALASNTSLAEVRPNAPRVTFMHVSINRLTIDGDEE
jgi:hypothetical protein